MNLIGYFYVRLRRSLEVSYVELFNPTLNQRKDFEILTRFRNIATVAITSLSY